MIKDSLREFPGGLEVPLGFEVSRSFGRRILDKVWVNLRV